MQLMIEDIDGIGPLYRPETGNRFPGLMILHGSEGPGAGWSHRFAAIMAAHGVAALPYGYGTGDVWGAGEIRNVDISQIASAGDRLQTHPRLASLDLFGWSRGGELAMHLGAIGGAALPFRKIAAHAPADHCVGAFDAARMRAQAPQDNRDEKAWVWPGHEHQLIPGAPIEIEGFPRPVFLSVGTADEVWDHEMTLNLAHRLAATGNPADLYLAEGQGHALDFATERELWSRLLAFIERA